MSISRNVLLLIVTVSTIIFLLGITIGVLFPAIYERKLEEQTNIVEKSMLYDMWVDLPLPIYQRLYFFNITNAKHYMENGGVLEVEEVGPYTYKSRWVKGDIEKHPNGTISYREVKTFRFVLEESVGSQDDIIHSLNGPLVMAADFLKGKGPTTRKAADKVFRFINEKLVIKAKVKELVFDGYGDPIIGFSRFFRPGTPFRGSKFCWLYGRNATDEGIFNVFTGEIRHDQLNIIDKWNGASNLVFWKDKYCNRINGTNGEFGPPLKGNQTTYTFFQPIFCRSITFNYTEGQIHRGIKSKRFQNTLETFSKSNPNNYCFDTDTELDSGVLDVSPCQFGAPVVLSFPHFYLADASFLDNVNGLDPNEENHSSHIDVEPLTGVSIDLSIKFQLNVRMSNVNYLSAFKKVEPGVYPIFWADVSAELTEDLAKTFKNGVYRPKTIAYAAVGCIIVVSAVMFVIAVWRLVKLRDEDEDGFCDDSERKPLLTKDGRSPKPTDSRAADEVSTNVCNISNDVPVAAKVLE